MYFEQRTHAYACVHMVENNEKRLKIIKKYYLDKLAHVQVVINCRDRDTPMCTCEDALAYILGAPLNDNVMSYNSLTINVIKKNKPVSKGWISTQLCQFISTGK